jgi:hypothetical protein
MTILNKKTHEKRPMGLTSRENSVLRNRKTVRKTKGMVGNFPSVGEKMSSVA